MLIKFPLTVLKHNPCEAASVIRRPHIEKMYEDGLNQLADVAQGNIKESRDHDDGKLVSQLRWAGSERFLFRLVEGLGIRQQKVDHEVYKTLYYQDFLDSTEIAPCWMSTTAVYNRHRSELCHLDNLDRIYKRWCQSINPNIVSIRDNGTPDDISYFIGACRDLEFNLDVGKIHLNLLLLNRFLDAHPLYTIGNSEFFQRNRYNSVTPCLSSDYTTPYIQRTMTEGALRGFLHARLRRMSP